MSPGIPLFADTSNCRLSRAGRRTKLSVVWLRGDHDVATRDTLAATLAEAIWLDEAAVVIDLSEVNFISLPTIGVIVDASKLLARRGRSLVLRAPPPFVRRVFDACGQSGLLRDPSAGGVPESSKWMSAESMMQVGPIRERFPIGGKEEAIALSKAINESSATFRHDKISGRT